MNRPAGDCGHSPITRAISHVEATEAHGKRIWTCPRSSVLVHRCCMRSRRASRARGRPFLREREQSSRRNRHHADQTGRPESVRLLQCRGESSKQRILDCCRGPLRTEPTDAFPLDRRHCNSASGGTGNDQLRLGVRHRVWSPELCPIPQGTIEPCSVPAHARWHVGR